MACYWQYYAGDICRSCRPSAAPTGLDLNGWPAESSQVGPSIPVPLYKSHSSTTELSNYHSSAYYKSISLSSQYEAPRAHLDSGFSSRRHCNPIFHPYGTSPATGRSFFCNIFLIKPSCSNIGGQKR